MYNTVSADSSIKLATGAFTRERFYSVTLNMMSLLQALTSYSL